MEKNKHLVNIKIEGEDWSNALNESYLKNNKKASIDGFRVGKAPFDVFVSHYGIESLYEDAINTVIQVAYINMLKDSKLEPVIMPKVEVKEVNKDFVEFQFAVITKPEVTIKKYEGLGIEKASDSVTSEEIQTEIDHLLDQYAELVIKEGSVALGDTIIFDYEGFVDGVAFDGGKAENYSLEIGSGQFIPGFEDSLIGMNKEEEREIKVTFPADYHAENLKGKDATFKVLIHEIKTKEKRELDAEFFEDLAMDGVNSLETLEESVKEHLSAHKKVDVENEFIENLLDAISKQTEVSIPEELVEDEVDHLIKQFADNISHQGVSLELYYQVTKTSEKDLRDRFERDAYRNVLYRLIIEKLINTLEIEANDQEVEDEIKNTASKYNVSEEEVIKETGGKDMIKYDIKVKKLFDKLTELNKIK